MSETQKNALGFALLVQLITTAATATFGGPWLESLMLFPILCLVFHVIPALSLLVFGGLIVWGAWNVAWLAAESVTGTVDAIAAGIGAAFLFSALNTLVYFLIAFFGYLLFGPEREATGFPVAILNNRSPKTDHASPPSP